MDSLVMDSLVKVANELKGDPKQMVAIEKTTFSALVTAAQGKGDDAELAPFLALQPGPMVALTAHDFCWLVDLAGRSSGRSSSRSSNEPGP